MNSHCSCGQISYDLGQKSLRGTGKFGYSADAGYSIRATGAGNLHLYGPTAPLEGGR